MHDSRDCRFLKPTQKQITCEVGDCDKDKMIVIYLKK